MNTAIIAIDPGTAQTAVVGWDGRVNMAVIWDNIAVLHFIASREPIPGERLCIEMIASYGMPVGREVFDTCVWIGRFFQAWKGIGPELIYRREVKLHHCASARAKDSNIRQALIDKYGAPGTKRQPGITYGLKSHLWAAFALATYVSERATVGASRSPATSHAEPASAPAPAGKAQSSG